MTSLSNMPEKKYLESISPNFLKSQRDGWWFDDDHCSAWLRNT